MRAAFVAPMSAPMSAPVARDAAVLIAGDQIVGIGDGTALRQSHRDAREIDYGDAIILPGLINAHTHLEHSCSSSGDWPGGDFGDWILSLRARAGTATPETSTRAGIEQCLRFGVTCVGDITQQIDATRSVLAQSPLRAVSYGEVLGLGKLRTRYEQLLPQAIDPAHQTARLTIGLTPHAPYTVDRAGFEQCLQIARDQHLPLATHLAETQEEVEFLATHGGMFRRVWDTVGQWDECVTHPGPPIRMAQELGLLDYPTLLAHVNYVNDDELATLARGHASVVYCPRTHAYFGHSPHRWREMLTRGINVAIGTDSCASSPNLNVVDDLRLLHRQAGEVPAEVLWQMVSTRAARALMRNGQAGAIQPGFPADLTVFAVETDDPLREILEKSVCPTAVWIDGRQI